MKGGSSEILWLVVHSCCLAREDLLPIPTQGSDWRSHHTPPHIPLPPHRRFKSLQKRALIEPRRKIEQKKQGKKVEYIHVSYYAALFCVSAAQRCLAELRTDSRPPPVFLPAAGGAR